MTAGFFSWTGPISAAVISSLMNPSFNASGQCDVTAIGSTYINHKGEQALSIADAIGWRVGPGIQVHAAGSCKLYQSPCRANYDPTAS